jgi:hypothetical protein
MGFCILTRLSKPPERSIRAYAIMLMPRLSLPNGAMPIFGEKPYHPNTLSSNRKNKKGISRWPPLRS